jgi:apolipoprotein N-acyltransferase
MFGILCIHERLLREVRPLEPDLLVWSETAFCPVNEPAEPLAYLLDGSFGDPEAPGGRRPMRDLVLQGPDQVTILGAIRRTALPASERAGPLDDDEDGLDERNVAWVVRGGRPTDVVYDKRGLAPFGEYIPLPRGWPGRELVKSMIRQAVHYVPDLNVGKEAVLFEAPSPSGPKKGALTICFEMVFPWYYRESARLGADFHVNISNDAWFDDSSELELVDVAAIFRAAETGRALFRVSNSGISTLIGPGGERLAVAADESGRRTQVRGTVHGRIPIAHGETAYVRWGDTPWFLPAAALLTALSLGTIRRKRFLPGASVR